MKYHNISVADLCNFLIDNGRPIEIIGKYNEFTKHEMYEFLKEKTDNFDFENFKYLISDIRNYANFIPFCVYEKNPEPNKINEDTGYPEDIFWTENIEFTYSLNNYFPLMFELEFPENLSLKKRIIVLKNKIPEANFHSTYKLIEFSDIAESEYKRVTESTPEPEILNELKIKLNRRQKIALLESTGVMKYLESNVFSGNQSQMAKYLSLIIDNSIQNIRKEINKAPEFLLNDPEINKVINPILVDLGLKDKN